MRRRIDLRLGRGADGVGGEHGKGGGDTEHRIRVTLELSRSDDPVLFDALAGLPKGRRRVARLRTLAHDGLTPPDLQARVPTAASDDQAGGSGRGDGRHLQALPDDEQDDEPEPGERAQLAPLAPEITGGIFAEPLDD